MQVNAEAGPSRPAKRRLPVAADFFSDDEEEQEEQAQPAGPGPIEPVYDDVQLNEVRNAPVAQNQAIAGQNANAPVPQNNTHYKHPKSMKNEVNNDQQLELLEDEPEEQDGKRDRILTDFAIVEASDPGEDGRAKKKSRMRELDPYKGKTLLAIGFATRAVEADEDEGQEDDGGDWRVPKGQRLRTSKIEGMYFDYFQPDATIVVETEHARYILRSPCNEYREKFDIVLSLLKLTAFVLSLGNDPVNAPEIDSLDELKAHARIHLLDGKSCTNGHLKSVAERIEMLFLNVIVDEGERNRIRSHPVASQVLALFNDTSVRVHITTPRIDNALSRIPRSQRMELRYDPDNQASCNSIDNAVIKSRNLTQNAVTPRMARLAKGWTSERLRLVGGEALAPKWREWNKARYRTDFERAVACARKPKRPLQNIDDNYLFKGASNPQETRRKPFRVDGVPYRVGDTALVPLDNKAIPDEIPDDARLEDYFRFAKILSVDILTSRDEPVHVLWYDHSSRTALGLPPASDNRELMLTPTCGEVKARDLCGNVRVVTPGVGLELNDGVAPERIDAHYFCRLVYDKTLPSFTDLATLPHTTRESTEFHCPSCAREKEEAEDADVRRLRGNGIRIKGFDFHVGDCVLFQRGIAGSGEFLGPEGVGSVGRIVDFSDRGHVVHVEQYVRRSDCAFEDATMAEMGVDALRDPRQLLVTNHRARVSADRIERPIIVKRIVTQTPDDMVSLADGVLRVWLNLSPDHFFAKWHWVLDDQESTEPPTLYWDDAQPISRLRPVCEPCRQASNEEVNAFQEFAQQADPVRILDLCSGTGAFAFSLMEGLACGAKTTHAVEISPSAMRSFESYTLANETVTFNTCINTFLDYMIKFPELEEDDDDASWCNLDGSRFGAPPKSGDIDCIVVGFPCQPHSTLNQFKQLDDVKSNLIMPILSIIEYLQPKYIYMENVKGIENFELSPTTQLIPKELKHTGLRFLSACLVALGYQFSYHLLNAAEFGAPQRRLRWFLVAAKSGEPLPKFPEPTHYVPDENKYFGGGLAALGMKVHPYSNETAIPKHPNKGRYLYSHVSILDAIEDLWTFDLSNPEILADKHDIPLPSMDGWDEDLVLLRHYNAGEANWNAKDDDAEEYVTCPKSKYYFSPMTRFQLEARVKAPTRPKARQLQHYTRYWNAQVSEFICNIPMGPREKKNYLGLPAGFQQYSRMLHDPNSANARKGHDANYYGRADKDSVFQTTVTNIGPTAKQCRCLHPWCYRTFTVRELARSQGFPDEYRFTALNNSITTMHRQIGNAVAWPVGQALGREFNKTLFQRWQAAA